MLYTSTCRCSNLPSWCSGMPTMSYVPESTSVFCRWPELTCRFFLAWNSRFLFVRNLDGNIHSVENAWVSHWMAFCFRGIAHFEIANNAFFANDCEHFWVFHGIPRFPHRPTSTSITRVRQEWQVRQHPGGSSGPWGHSLHARRRHRASRLLLVGGRSMSGGWGRRMVQWCQDMSTISTFSTAFRGFRTPFD